MTSIDSPVLQWLQRQAIDFEIIEIPLSSDRKPIRSLEQLAEEKGINPDQIVRSILFRTGSGGFAMLAISGRMRADWGALRKHLNERRLALAEPEEVLNATGAPVGAVAPVVLKTQVPILADAGILTYDKVWMGSGVLGYAVELSSEDLKRAFEKHGAQVGHFAKPAA